MSAGDGAERGSHDGDGETVGEGDAEKAEAAGAMQILVRADRARAEKNKRKRPEEFRDQFLRCAVHSKVSVRGKQCVFDSNVCILAGMRRGAPALLTNVSPDSRNSINCAEASPRGARDRKTGDRSAAARSPVFRSRAPRGLASAQLIEFRLSGETFVSNAGAPRRIPARMHTFESNTHCFPRTETFECTAHRKN